MAKVSGDQLHGQLQKSLAGIYLVTGDDALLLQEACDDIRQHAVAQGFSEREVHHTDSGFSWDTLTSAASAMSLFAEKKIIEVRVHNGKPGDAGSKAIVEYCSNISDDNLLLLVMPKIDRRSHNSKWFKALDKSGVVVTIWPIGLPQLPRWITQRLHLAELTADRDAIDILCAKVEGNLLAAAQEIEKLKLIATGQHIDALTMADAVTDSARYDVFSLADKSLAGDARAAVECLHGLRAEGTEATLLLWALSRELRTLTHIKESMDAGKSFDFSAKQMGVWDKRKNLIKHAVFRLNLRQLHTLIRKSGHADKMIKGLAKGEVWNVLLDIVLSLSGTDVLNAKATKLTLQLAI